jgi:ribosomal protein L20A (L18A)
MNTYTVTYSGNASYFKNFETIVNAFSERQAVEDVYADILSANYFPMPHGTIQDCDGHTICEVDDDTIEYDGGCFSATLIED